MKAVEKFTPFQGALGKTFSLEGILRVSILRFYLFAELEESRRTTQDLARKKKIEHLILEMARLFWSLDPKDIKAVSEENQYIKRLQPFLKGTLPQIKNFIESPLEWEKPYSQIPLPGILDLYYKASSIVPTLLRISRENIELRLKLLGNRPFADKLRLEFKNLLDRYDAACTEFLARLKSINALPRLKALPLQLSYFHPDFHKGIDQIILMAKELKKVPFTQLIILKGFPMGQALKRVEIAMKLVKLPRHVERSLSTAFQGLTPTFMPILVQMQQVVCKEAGWYAVVKNSVDRILNKWLAGFSSQSIAINPIQVMAQRFFDRAHNLREEVSRKENYDFLMELFIASFRKSVEIYERSRYLYQHRQMGVETIKGMQNDWEKSTKLLTNCFTLTFPYFQQPKVAPFLKETIQDWVTLAKLSASYVIPRLNEPLGKTFNIKTDTDRAFFKRQIEILCLYLRAEFQGEHITDILDYVEPRGRWSSKGEAQNLYAFIVDGLRAHKEIYKRIYRVWKDIDLKDQNLQMEFIKAVQFHNRLLGQDTGYLKEYYTDVSSLLDSLGRDLKFKKLIMGHAKKCLNGYAGSLFYRSLYQLEIFSSPAKSQTKKPPPRVVNHPLTKVKEVVQPPPSIQVKAPGQKIKLTPYELLCQLPQAFPNKIEGEASWDTFRRWRQMHNSAKGLRLRWQLLEEGKHIKDSIGVRARLIDNSLYCEEVAKFNYAGTKPYSEKVYYTHGASTLGKPVTQNHSDILRKVFWFFAPPSTTLKEKRLSIPQKHKGAGPTHEVEKLIQMHFRAQRGQLQWIDKQPSIQLKSNDPQLSLILQSIDQLKTVGADTPLFCVTRHVELHVNLLSTAAKLALRKRGKDLEKQDEWGRPLKHSHDVEKLIGKNLELFRGDPRYLYARWTQLSCLVSDVELLCHIKRSKGFLTQEEERIFKQKGWDLQKIDKEIVRYIEQARRRTNLALKLAKEVLASSVREFGGD